MKKLISFFKLFVVLFILSGSVFAQPNPPANLTATAISQNEIGLQWTESSDSVHVVNGFKIDRSPDGVSGWTQIADIPDQNARSYSNSGLTVNTTYFYRVSAYNNSGNSGYSLASATTLSNSLPVAPSGLTITGISNDQVDLQWTDNSNDDTGFEIKRTGGGAGTVLFQVGPNVTTYSDITVLANKSYSYYIRALKGTVHSVYTSPAVPAVTLPILSPSGLTLTVISNSQIDLAWIDNSQDSTVFEILRTGGTGGPMTFFVGPNITTFSDMGLTANTTYHYKIRAVKGTSYSAWSSLPSALTLPVLAPSDLSVTSILIHEIDIQWTDNSPDETGFEIRRIGPIGLVEYFNVGPNTTTFSDITVAANTTYHYAVRALKGTAHSTFSTSVQPKTPGTVSFITDLKADVVALHTGGAMNNIQTNALKSSLNSAKNYLTPVPYSIAEGLSAIADLNTFIGLVTTYMAPPIALTAAQGNPLIASANYIISLINIGDSPLEIIPSMEIPHEYALHNNYPNPFNPVTKISFDIPKQGPVSLKIYDMVGREVRTLVNEVKSPGIYEVDFNGSELSSGVYFYRLQSAEFTDIKRMLLIK